MNEDALEDDPLELHVDAAVPADEARVEVKLPELWKWKGSRYYDYENQINDYESLEELGAAITKARMAVFVLTDKINGCEREERLARITYEREYRREFMKSTERTDSAKRMRAALKCEELENEWIKYEQLKKEFERMAFTMRTELQTLQTIANNLRQQLKQI